jgi:putative inorganic carbon (hco3(-)) transporter
MAVIISAQRPVRGGAGFASRAGIAFLAIAAGLAVAGAIGAGVKLTLLIAALIAPFALLVVFARPHWAVATYVVLVYADLLSILVQYQGLPSLARLAGFLLLGSVLGYRLIIHKQGLVSDPVTWWLIVYGLVVALGLLYARDPDLVMTEVVEFVRSFLTYLVVINGITTLRRLTGSVYGLLAIGVLLASLTVFQTVTGDFSQEFGGLAQAKVTGITELTDAPRPGGTLGDANYYGQSLLIVLPFAFYLVSKGKGSVARLAGIASIITLVAAIIFTYSRGDLLALAWVIFAALIYKRPRLPYIVAGLGVLVLLLSFLPATYYARLSTLLDIAGGNRSTIIAESSLRGRAGAATAAVSMFADHPLLGVGRHNYPLYELDYVTGTDFAFKSQGIPPHDLYLEIAAEQGAIGLIVVSGLLITAGRALLEARRRFLAAGLTSQAELAVWLAIALSGYLVSSVFLHGAYLYMLWLQIALIVALRQIARLETSSPEPAPVLPPPDTSMHVLELPVEIPVQQEAGMASPSPAPAGQVPQLVAQALADHGAEPKNPRFLPCWRRSCWLVTQQGTGSVPGGNQPTISGKTGTITATDPHLWAAFTPPAANPVSIRRRYRHGHKEQSCGPILGNGPCLPPGRGARRSRPRPHPHRSQPEAVRSSDAICCSALQRDLGMGLGPCLTRGLHVTEASATHHIR